MILYLLKQYKQFKYYDEFGIRKQVKRICWVGFIGGVLYWIIAAIDSLIRDGNGNSTTEIIFIPWIILLIVFSILMYYEVLYPIHYNCNYNNNNNNGSNSNLNSIARSRLASKSRSTVGYNMASSSTPSVGPIQIKNWMEIVSTTVGYQSFMNHLETEFSVENLLFLTEYIQIKNVLKMKFESIFTKLNQDSDIEKKIGFDVSFPAIDLDENKGNNINNSALNLLATVTTVTTTPVSLMAKKLYHDLDVINAFECLYNKYIDPKNAPFMINISSIDRKRILIAFSKKDERKSLTSFQLHMRSHANVENNKNVKMVIEQEFDKNNKSTEWLLIYVLTKFDGAAHQVSRLMSNAFMRYQSHGINY